MTNRIKNPRQQRTIANKLDQFSTTEISLPGISSPQRKSTLVAQMVDSRRRIEFLHEVSRRSTSSSLFTPYSGCFNPLSGAVTHYKQGKIDDAYWLVYLATHFGKHKIDAWNLTEDIYGKFLQGGIWDWNTASQNPSGIENWLASIYPQITSSGRSRRFGNHRKYETLKPGPKGTGHAIKTYINWIKTFGSHIDLIRSAQSQVGQNPRDVFCFLYKELDNVSKLGRLGKFDLLCNLSNLQIAPIIPDKAYIMEATGPKKGAMLLFGNRLNANELENSCTKLADYLSVSAQVVEDSLCNWQKSPATYKYFRG